jgi:hypothetical protein
MRKIHGVVLLFALSQAMQAATVLSENFDSFSSLLAGGWTVVNNSTGAGANTTSWFQGNPANFSAQAGAANSYAAANYLNASFGGNINDWLLTPVLSLANGSTISFYTQSDGALPDRLEVRFSANGSSANVADFTNLLLTVNSGLTGAGYPTTWTQFNINIAGLPAGFSIGRLAFRYNVPDTSTNGDYIGIDTLLVTTAVPEPATFGMALGAGLAMFVLLRRGLNKKKASNF